MYLHYCQYPDFLVWVCLCIKQNLHNLLSWGKNMQENLPFHLEKLQPLGMVEIIYNLI